jgi:hypothetical protein
MENQHSPNSAGTGKSARIARKAKRDQDQVIDIY